MFLICNVQLLKPFPYCHLGACKYREHYLSLIHIWTIPIGYADGWTRDLQGFHVIVDGQDVYKRQVLDYQFYVDFEASPMIMKAYSGTDHAFFEQAFENLLHDFEDILESQENSKK